MLAGLREFLADLPALSRRRVKLQARRVRSDLEILSLFGTHWLRPSTAPEQKIYDVTHAIVTEHLGIQRAAQVWGLADRSA